jgi:hypothetical protein
MPLYYEPQPNETLVEMFKGIIGKIPFPKSLPLFKVSPSFSSPQWFDEQREKRKKERERKR